MSFPLPFSPTSQATQGNTVLVSAGNTSVAGTLDCTTLQASRVRVCNTGAIFCWVRMSREPQASIAATNADIPLAAGGSIVLQNPNPAGKTGLAVLSSTAGTCNVFFTPGEGGS